MTELYEKAFAKLNFGLDVGRKMDDGYHEVATVIQSIDLHDDISIRLDGSGELRAKSNLSYLPEGDKNIAVKAAKLFFEASGIKAPGGVIEISKAIPVCAGMAGGSTDAAAVLRALNKGFGTGLSADRLRELASGLGADVPFCVEGGTAFCTGRGEQVRQLPSVPDCLAVVCKPPFPISTPELFAVLDTVRVRHRPDMTGLRRAIESGDLTGAARYIYNVFEAVLPPRCSEILTIKARLLDMGALGASMTGTGSAVFGLFTDPGTAEAAYAALSADYSACFLTKMQQKI